MAAKDDFNDVAGPGRRVSILVVTVPGRLRDSLLALLNSLPGVQQVYQAVDVAAARATAAREAPAVLILDWDLWGPEAAALLSWTRAQALRPICVGVVNGQSQQAAAWEAGVEMTLLRGFSVQDLGGVVQSCTLAAASGPAQSGS